MCFFPRRLAIRKNNMKVPVKLLHSKVRNNRPPATTVFTFVETLASILTHHSPRLNNANYCFLNYIHYVQTTKNKIQSNKS